MPRFGFALCLILAAIGIVFRSVKLMFLSVIPNKVIYRKFTGSSNHEQKV